MEAEFHSKSSDSRDEQRRRFFFLLVVRAAVVTALLGSTLYFNIHSGHKGLTLTRVLLYALAAAVFVLTLVYGIWIKKIRGPLGFHLQFQVIFDVIVASLLVYITGGIESPFTFFYALPIIQTAVFFPRRAAVLTAGLGCLLLGGLYVLENQGFLPVDLEGRLSPVPGALRVSYLLAFNYSVFFAIAWLAGSLADQLRQTGRELQQTEREVESLVALNRDIVQSLRSGLIALDENNRIALLNPVAETILGVYAQQCDGKDVGEVFSEMKQFLGDMDTSSGRNLESKTVPMRMEVEHKRQDGSVLPVGLTMSPLTSTDGKAIGTLVHMQDLTEIKAMEKEKKLSDRMAAVGTMAAVMAHELRNPLASMSGASQMLKDVAGLSDADKKLMDIIMRETSRLDDLLSDFLKYARPKDPKMKKGDLRDTVAETLHSFEQRSGCSGLQIESELDPCMAFFDSDHITQVLMNLLVNAEQATDGCGKIFVRSYKKVDENHRHWSVVDVSDDGPGIPPELGERIMEPFVTTRERGTGLGLAIVVQIVEAHSGVLEVQGLEKGGSLFRVMLPGVSS